MVYVVTPSKDVPNDAGELTGVVNAVQVELGATVKESVEVRGILEPGTLVVVRGNERLRSGGAVTFCRYHRPKHARRQYSSSRKSTALYAFTRRLIDRTLFGNVADEYY